MTFGEKNREALKQVSDELARQPKQKGEGTVESKEKRAEAEKKLTDPGALASE